VFRTAEILLHLIAETMLGFSHDDAVLAESLVALSLATESPVSQYVKNHINSGSSSDQVRSFAKYCDKQTLKYICLGYDCDVDWEGLPRDIREFVVGRCNGHEETLTKKQQDWLAFNKDSNIPMSTFIARCNFGAYVALSSRRYALGTKSATSFEDLRRENIPEMFEFLKFKHSTSKYTTRTLVQRLKVPFSIVYHNIGVGLKLLAIAFVAEPELQRELDYALTSSPKIVRSSTMFLITQIWRYTRTLQSILLPIFLLHGRDNVKTLWSRIGGTAVTIQKRQRISIESNDGSSTAFIHSPYGEAGTYKIYQYAGVLDREPGDKSKLQRISTYSRSKHLLRREDYLNGGKINTYKYDYASFPEKAPRKLLSKSYSPRYPLTRKCVEGKNEFEEHIYNRQGLVERGSFILHGSLVRFSCHYRQGGSFEDELLRAEFVLPHMTCTVAWSAPPKNNLGKLDQWIPSSQVMEATFVLGSDVYESRWIYDHKFHPTILTTLNGDRIDTPPIIQYDHLG